MDNLNNSNLILRTLTPKEYTELIDDLNFNFLQILSLPGFKGMRGQSITGAQGVGIRGSKWVFVQLVDLAEEYNLTDYTQITLEWVNSVFLDDPERFFGSLYIPNDNNLLLGDVLVLPNGSIITLSEITDDNETEIKFVDSGITFNEVTSVSETRVIQIFQEMYSQANTGLGATRHYNAVAKNATDDSPQLNTQANTDSAVDIVSSDSGQGAPLLEYTFLGTSETAVTPSTKLCLLVGSAKTYHRLVQGSQENFNNDYVPGVDDFAGLVLLQNNNKNGLIFGNKSNADLRKFGRLYHNGMGSVLTSSYSPNQSEYSDITLTDTRAIIRALKATINTLTTEILSENFQSNYLSWDQAQAYFGHGLNKKLWIGFNQGVYLKNILGANILSTDNEGKIVKRYTVSQDFDTHSHTDIVTSRAIWEELLLIHNQLGDIGTLNEEMGRRIFMSRFEAPIENETISPSTLTDHGTYTLLKGNKFSGRVGNRHNAILANDALMTVHRWEDESVNYEYVIQRVVAKHPMFEPLGDTISGENNPILTPSPNNQPDHVIYRRGRRSQLDGENVFTFTDWTWELNDVSMIRAEEPLIISGDLRNNNLSIKHKKTTINDATVRTEGIQSDMTVRTSQPNTNTRVVKRIVFDDHGHATEQETVDLEQLMVSRQGGGVKNVPWIEGNSLSTFDAIMDLIKQTGSKTINTPLRNHFTNSDWVAISNSNNLRDANSHNLQGHTVEYKIDNVTSLYSRLIVRIKNTDPSYLPWNRNTMVFSGAVYVSDSTSSTQGREYKPIVLMGNEFNENQGDWTMFHLMLTKPSVVKNVSIRITLNRV